MRHTISDNFIYSVLQYLIEKKKEFMKAEKNHMIGSYCVLIKFNSIIESLSEIFFFNI